MPEHETHHRDQRRQAVYDRALNVAARQYPNLAPAQHKALAVAIQEHAAFATYFAEGVFDPGDDWIASEYRVAMEHFSPQMFRSVPDAAQLTLALVAKLPANHLPQEAITLARRVTLMSADERLAASEGLDMKAPASKAAEPKDTRTVEQIEKKYTPEDLILAARGHDVDKLDPAKRQEYRREIARESAPAPTPSIEKARLLQSLGKAPTTITMMAADREAKALGKTLADFGVDVTS